MTFCKTVLSLAILLAASALSAFAQGTFTQIDYPGAVSTGCIGIDTAGDIVGQYGDANGIYHGFLLSAGVYTTIDYPGQAYTALGAINDVGQIVGASFGSVDVGFLYDIQTQTFSILTFPDSLYVAPGGINNAGTIVGEIAYPESHSPQYVGFELVGGIYKKVLPPGFLYSGVRGINNLGEAVGGGTKNGTQENNFLIESGKVQPLNLHVSNPDPVAINDAGAIVGAYDPSVTVLYGFLYQNGIFHPLGFPLSTWTSASGINDSGEVVGFFRDASGNDHGYTWTPPPAAAGKK